MQSDLIALRDAVIRRYELTQAAFSRRMTSRAVRAREVFCGLARARTGASPRQIAEVVGCHRTAVIRMIRRWQARLDREPDLAQTYEMPHVEETP